MRRALKSCSLSAVLVVSGCSAIIPEVPPDFALPVQEILTHTACELQGAFRLLDRPEYRRFHAKRWFVTVTLAPKVDTNVNVSGGLTRKNPFLNNPTRFVTWAVSGPGVQFDAKGARSGGINFTFVSAKLMADKQLRCDVQTASMHALAQHLGIGAWLERSAVAILAAPSAEIDRPIYNTDITIRMSGNGSYTYTFPPGADLATFGGSYSVDEQLNISMAPIEEKAPISAVTLPSGTNFVDDTKTSRQVSSSAPVDAARSRLDTIQIEQAIRSLRVVPSQ
ncbi:hypothetical protein [Bradyrhizobium paxllaeri]|uniref:hypothetical protein n=1 Tax=Bradyrhizobium paxllaeri TaxID=190148 RepID=UPI001146928D|nr:hypothetical protein [Bradyrhizobium paxllaeri]